MAERPILFSGEMVRAILSGRKTQTRRTRGLERLTERGEFLRTHVDERGRFGALFGDSIPDDPLSIFVPSPFGGPGDRLWVRETWTSLIPTSHEETARAHRDRVVVRPDDDERVALWYRADGEMPLIERLFGDDEDAIKWRPSIHMPRWASRITLEVTGVRVERLQAISEADAKAEGVTTEWTTSAGEQMTCSPREAFSDLWCTINGADSWAANPWVWVVEFQRATT